MPKRVPKEAKRVPLNCLVLPETLEYLKSADRSQGVVVDQAVAALRRMPPPVVDGMVNQGRGNQDPNVPLAQVARTVLKRQARSFKGPLLRPKDKKK